MKQFDKDNIVAGPYFGYEDAAVIVEEFDKITNQNPDLVTDDFKQGFVCAFAFMAAPEYKPTAGMGLKEFIENGLEGVKQRKELLDEIERLPFPLNLIVADSLLH